MIFTAQQLQDLHKRNGSNGAVLLPGGARLSPLAADYVRAKKISLTFGDMPAPTQAAEVPKTAGAETKASSGSGGQGRYWWCDGPCGPAKAAIAMQARQMALRPIALASEATKIAGVIEFLAREVKSGRAAGGVLLVRRGAAAIVLANRCPSLRAIVGTSMDAVEQGAAEVAANVLVIEHPHQTLQQVQNLLARFLKVRAPLSAEMNEKLAQLAAVG